MTQSEPPFYLRLLQISFFSVLGGVGLGLVNAVIYQPTPKPGQPLAYEWYIFVYLAGAFWGAIGGGLVGFVLAFLRQQRVVWGAVVGTCGGWQQECSPPGCCPSS